MDLFGLLSDHQYGQVFVQVDPASGLRAIIAVHDSRLGPALGGCRFIHYDRDEDAMRDALRLARGMTYKAAISGLNHGGGKSVILKPRGEFDRKALFTSFGRFLEDLGGHYVTAEDSGTSMEDMETIRAVTKNVTGIDPKNGGSGDPSPFTALGVRRGLEACVEYKLGRKSLEGVHVAVKGVGHVGWYLCRELHALGAKLSVSDIDAARTQAAAQEFGATVVDNDTIHALGCDVYAPCALGAGLNDETIPAIQATIIAGAANNQLAESRHGDELHKRGILYAPDYAINAGGLVNVAAEASGAYNADASRAKVLTIYDTLFTIAERSAKTNIPTWKVSDTMAEERLAAASKKN
jgi:leucine dehydrogenase